MFLFVLEVVVILVLLKHSSQRNNYDMQFRFILMFTMGK